MATLVPDEQPPEALGLDLDVLAHLLRSTGPLAFVDVETTGLPDDPDAGVLEIGAVLLDPDTPRVATLAARVRPAGPLPRALERRTGLSAAEILDAPTLAEIAPSFALALAGRTLVAHNAEFARHFLVRFVASELGEERFLDTWDLVDVTHPDAPDFRLETFARDLPGGVGGPERGALRDALDTARLVASIAASARSGAHRTEVARSALETYVADSPWLPLLSDDRLPIPQDPPGFHVPIPWSDEPPVPFDEDAIASVLADEERGRRWFPGYRVREGQIEMARHFVRLLGDGGTLLCEGGTGVGKSLAYLAAAIPFAMERAMIDEREPVVVSTRTKLLQDQLLAKDIPAAAAMLGYPELRALSIKGRANYVCSRRLAAVLAEGREPRLIPEDRSAFAVLSACARTRRHGEVGTLPSALLFRYPPLRDLVRSSIAARAEHCTREQCALEKGCSFGRRRAALAKANLVVANHDLLLRWPPDFPRFAHVIVDEAHELAGVVDEVYAQEVRPAEVLERHDELFGTPTPRRGRATERTRRERDAVPPRQPDTEARERRRMLRQGLVALGGELARRSSEYGEFQLPARAERLLPDAAELARTAADRLEDAAAAADAEEASRAPEEEDPRAQLVTRATGELRAAAQALRGAFDDGDEGHVAGFDGLVPPYDEWRLAMRAVAPADAFHDRFASNLDAFACVSATLFVGGDSFAALGPLEVERTEPAPECLSVESPIPYREHMRVVAMDAGEDLVPATAEALSELTRQLDGRTLGLFTSLRRMRDVAKRLSDDLRPDGFDVLLPRRATDDPAALVDRFRRAGAGGVLLGSRTFWQGLDIPGDPLQALVIEKLPFEVPTELRKRREARLRAAGENAFARYSVGVMLLNLKQMIGRLIRSEEDRGLVLIVEGRPDRPYFRRLAEALPEGCGVEVAGLDALPGLLAAVGIGGGTIGSPAEEPVGGLP